MAVFAKSDIQPILNQGGRKEDVAASIFQAVVDQTVAGLTQGRELKGKIVFLGGSSPAALATPSPAEPVTTRRTSLPWSMLSMERRVSQARSRALCTSSWACGNGLWTPCN